MKKSRTSYSIRFLAMFLSVLLVLLSVPLTVLAVPADPTNSAATYNHDVFEVKERRNAYTKHFKLEDGTFTAVQYDVPIHYQDIAGDWQDIDNHLKASGNEYVTSNARVKFSKKVTGNEVLFTLHDGNRKITISMDGAIKKTSGVVTNTNTEFDQNVTQLQKLTTLDHLSSRILYADILDGVDLEYVIESLNIKENIIVKEKRAQYSFSFTISLNNLDAKLNTDGSVDIFDAGTEQSVYQIPAPIVYDANNQYAAEDTASFELEKTGEHTYRLRVAVDPTWMNADSRVFPVVIDPAIYTSTGAPVDDTYINSASPTLTPYSQAHLYAGSTTTAYWKTALPELPNSAYITNATFTMNYITTTGTSASYLGAYPVTSAWDSTLSYNQYNTGTAGQRSTKLLDYNKIDLIQSEYSWNITEIVKEWYNGEPNYGIAIGKISGYTASGNIKFHSNNAVTSSRPTLSINYKDMKGIEEYWTFTSQNVGMAGNSYVNTATGALSFSIGTMTTTDALFAFTPSLVYNQALAGKYNKTENAEVPYSKAMHGYGFKFNMNETIVARTYVGEYNTNVTYYIWSDSDGTEHYFLPQIDENGYTIYQDEDGLLLTLDVEGASYSITDLNHNVRLFTKTTADSSSINAGGFLTGITDRNGNQLRFQYNEFGRITSVQVIPKNNSAITYFKITHNSYGQVNRILNENTQQAVILYYSSAYNGTSISPYNGGYLRKVVHAHQTDSTLLSNWTDFMTDGSNTYITVDAQATYEYDSAGRLISAYDHMSDYKMEYIYTGNRVTGISETAAGKPGQEISLQYFHGYTEVRTSGTDDIYGTADDLIEVYNFDTEGRVINSYTTNADKTQIFGAISGEYESKEIVKNNIRVSSSVGGSATNFILNGNFEEKDASNSALYWTHTSNGTPVRVTGSITAKNNTTDMLYQYVYLPEGQYTLSMDVNTHNTENVSVEVIAKSLTNPAHVFTDKVPVNKYYASGTTAFTSSSFSATNEQSSGGEKFQIIIRVIGGNVNTNPSPVVTVDNIMLENNIGKSPFSMVDFGNFENYAINANGSVTQTYADHWTGVGGGWSVVNTEQPFGKALRITGSLSATRTVSQTVYQVSDSELSNYDYGNPFDDRARTYLISGFAKGTQQVANPDSHFRIRVEITYYKGSGNPVETETKDLDFQTHSNDWQFVSASFTTKDYQLIKEIKIICEYTGHPGVAYFDNISMSLDSDQSTVVNEYYDNGLVQVKKNGYYTEIYEYDSNKNLKRIANNRGEIFDYTYTSTNNVATEIYYEFYNGYPSNHNYPYQYVNPDQYITKTPVTKTVHSYNQYGQLLSSDTYLATTSGSSVVAVSGTKHLTTVNAYHTVPGSPIFGALTSSTDHLGHTSRYFYDQNKGYLLAAIKPDAQTGMCYEYDAIGNITKVQPATYTYNSYTPVTGQEEVVYEYNDQQMLSAIITGATEYNFTYNVFGQNESVAIGDNEILSYEYYESGSDQTLVNNNGNGGKLRKITYSNGFSVRYVYDELDNIKEIWYTNNGVEAKAFGYTYTAFGQLYRFDNFLDETATVYKYDGENRLVHYIEFDTGDDTNKFSTTIFYNDEGLLSSLTYKGDYAAGTETTYYNHHYYHAYNTDGSLNYFSVSTDTTDGEIEYQYDDYKRLQTKVLDFYRSGSSTTRFTNTVTYEYVNAGAQTSALVSKYRTKVNSNAERSISYTYDENGNITQKVDSDGRTYRYAYDDLGQLIREDDVYNGYTWVYEYDNSGNITYKKRYPLCDAGETPTGTAYGYAFTYTNTEWGDQVTSINGIPITYDDFGNPITWQASLSLTWRNGNELATVTGDDFTASYTYNDSGYRTSKTIDGVKHTYRLDGSLIIAEEFGNHLYLYLYDAEGTPIGLQYRNSSYAEEEFDTYWFEKNLQGDVIGIYTDGGVLVATYEYNAWGELLNWGYLPDADGTYETLAQTNPFRYRGYYYDTETGLYYLNSRYYDASVCRFLSPDSAGILEASPMGLSDKNLYAYCDNNPVMRRDDGGMFWDTVFDVVSLVCSVVDVIKNPDDPWAWAGLAADVVSLAVPFATGGGTIMKVASNVDGVVDAARSVGNATDAIDTAMDSAKLAGKTTEEVSKVAKKLHRPYIRKSTREAVEAAAERTLDGKFLDANTGEVITGKYDLGHVYGHEFWRERDMAMAKGWTQKQFNDYMNNPDFYRIEDPHTNRSHRYEKPR